MKRDLADAPVSYGEDIRFRITSLQFLRA